MQTLTFDSILDAIETLSVDEQTTLLAIVHRRLSDLCREYFFWKGRSDRPFVISQKVRDPLIPLSQTSSIAPLKSVKKVEIP